MAGTVIITSTAADLTPGLATARGIIVVPSVVTFGSDEYRAGVDLSVDAFWDRMMVPDAPYPITAPPPPGAFRDAYEAAFASGADAIVSVQISAQMSATMNSARVAAEMVSDREIHLVDTGTASIGTGLLALLAAEMAELGVAAAEIARVLARRTADVQLFAALDTLDYLRQGGRLSGPAARIGAFLSVKPIISIVDGQVAVVDRVRSLGEASERVIAMLTRRPVQRLAILYSPPADGDAFRDEVVERMPGDIDPTRVIVYPVGATVGPHVGPGCLGGVMLTAMPA
jgi:DegV family protein with EDD domain